MRSVALSRGDPYDSAMATGTSDSGSQVQHICEPQCGLEHIHPEIAYFALTLRDNHGKLERSVESHFVGLPEGVEPGEGIELREASEADPDNMTQLWESAGHDWTLVNDAAQLRVFILRGGHALVAEDVAREHFADLVEPHQCISKGAVGFMRYRPDAPDSNVRSRRKQKRRILERDGHQCQHCGTRQTDDGRTRLEAHHIRPFSKLGPTTDSNLVTLCRECNELIGDEFRPDLYWTTGGSIASGTVTEEAEAHCEAVERYRNRVLKMLEDRKEH